MNVQRISAFSLGREGGNPAGVVLLSHPVSDADMARVAAEVGYSETAFAVAQDKTSKTWRVRYFAPESEVPFCGHATIALGAELGRQFGAGTYTLMLNEAEISVQAEDTPDGMMATLASPPTRSRPLSDTELHDVMSLFGLHSEELDLRIPPAHIHAGANHAVLALNERSRLASMDYALDAGRTIMRKLDLVTIMLVYCRDSQVFDARNAFASGGVLEDPATGAAAAAFGGYLRDINWPHGGSFTIHQGEDMGCPSRIKVSLSDLKGTPVQVSGLTREILQP